MENQITAEKAGTVKEIKVAAGDTVGAGDVVVVIAIGRTAGSEHADVHRCSMCGRSCRSETHVALLDDLEQHVAVCNIVVLAAVTSKPDGHVVLFDVVREAADEIVDARSRPTTCTA